ncbi:translation initiation factor eIF-3 subunit 4 [Pseudohyphozyma bogoriensis]|nr:translation initiation factor eIF-3 subunit 4 [Pseudohyphozyma bogoriensis]
MAPALQSWADDVESNDFPPRTETTDKDGITTIVEYKLNDEGVKVKVTRRIKRTLVKSTVNHAVAERMGWAKFGAEKGNKPGPDTATTTVGENVRLKLQPGGIKEETEEDENAAIKKQLASKAITCRLCSGDHWTNRCPYKDTLGGIAGDSGAKGGAGESMHSKNRDDLPTLRVTNLSEDAQDADLWDLFSRFGKINRIYVGKDQETGLCKGFAFVSFESRMEAEKAMQKINGLPYDHLILGCTWSIPKSEMGAK